MESVKRGPEMDDAARAWLAGKLAQLVVAHDYPAVDRAIEHCLENSPYRPDISEIRAALGASAAQTEKVAADTSAVKAADAWTKLEAHLKRYGSNDVHGVYRLRSTDWKVARDQDGQVVMVTGPKGYLEVKHEAVPVPALAEQTVWCMEHIGGLAKIMSTPDKYRDVVRREFLKAWPLYTGAAASLALADHPEVERMLTDAQPHQRVM